MNLPENTKYSPAKNYSPYLGKMAELNKQVGETVAKMKPSKSFDTSKYGGVVSSVKRNASTKLGSLGSVTTPYGGKTKFESYHPGVDIANQIGTDVPSFVSGTVTEVVGGHKQGDKGYGNYVVIKDTEGNLHRYSHLQNAYVKVGQGIAAGNVIGGMGNTGSTYSNSGGTGSHLDYRVRDLYGRYVDPNRFISK